MSGNLILAEYLLIKLKTLFQLLCAVNKVLSHIYQTPLLTVPYIAMVWLMYTLVAVSSHIRALKCIHVPDADSYEIEWFHFLWVGTTSKYLGWSAPLLSRNICNQNFIASHFHNFKVWRQRFLNNLFNANKSAGRSYYMIVFLVDHEAERYNSPTLLNNAAMKLSWSLIVGTKGVSII